MTQSQFVRRPAWLVVIATLACTLTLDHFAWTLYRAFAGEPEGAARIAALAIFRYGPWVFGPAFIAALLFGLRAVPGALGFNRSPIKAVVFALGVTSIMLATLAVTAPFSPPDDFAFATMQSVFLPGVVEEILFRAFMFGFLFRFAGWGFLPAAFVGGVLFGAGHLYQSGDPAEAAAIFAITSLGALWFAWLYVEWDYNIWVPASLHVCMNLWWELFNVSETALGPTAANIVRFVVIFVSIGVTIAITKQRKIRGRIWLINDRAST